MRGGTAERLAKSVSGLHSVKLVPTRWLYRARHRKHDLLRRCGQGSILMYFTYVLRSLRDNKLYIGFTKDLKLRFNEHISGKVYATKERRTLKLIYYEACTSKIKAIKREKYFKTGFGRRFLKTRI